MNLHELNGDSKISQIEFINGFISFLYEDFIFERMFEVRIKTDIAFINSRLDEFAYEYCNIRKYSLNEFLKIDEKSKLYIMPEQFISQMKIARQKFHLAVGLNSDEWKYFIQVIGYGIIVACPIKSDDSIDIIEIGSLITINPN